jgi:hypothetical protein
MSLIPASLASSTKNLCTNQEPVVFTTTYYHRRVLLCEQIVREVVVSSADQQSGGGSQSVTYDSNRVHVQQEFLHQQRQDTSTTTTTVNGDLNRIPVPVLSPDYIKKFQNKKVGKKKQIAWTDERKAVSEIYILPHKSKS